MLDIDKQNNGSMNITKWREKPAKPSETRTALNFVTRIFIPPNNMTRKLLEMMAEMQAEGLGEVEIHLHHGIEKPDTAENLRKVLTEFRDSLAEEHFCLSRFDGAGNRNTHLFTVISRWQIRSAENTAALMKKCRFLPIRAVMPI